MEVFKAGTFLSNIFDVILVPCSNKGTPNFLMLASLPSMDWGLGSIFLYNTEVGSPAALNLPKDVSIMMKTVLGR